MKLKLINKLLLVAVTGVTLLSACSSPEPTYQPQKQPESVQPSNIQTNPLAGYNPQAWEGWQFNNFILINKTIPSSHFKEITERFFNMYPELGWLKSDMVVKSVLLYRNQPIGLDDSIGINIVWPLIYYTDNDWNKWEWGMQLQLVLLDQSIWNLPPKERLEGSKVTRLNFAHFREAIKNNTDERDYKYLNEIIDKLLSIDINKVLELNKLVFPETVGAKQYSTFISKWLGLSNGARLYLNNEENKLAIMLMGMIFNEVQFVMSSRNFGINQISPQFIFATAQINNALAEKDSKINFVTPSTISHLWKPIVTDYLRQALMIKNPNHLAKLFGSK